jgi:hypothetical protein
MFHGRLKFLLYKLTMHLRFPPSYFMRIFLAVVIYMSYGCNRIKIIEEEKFIEIYTDIIIAKDTVSETKQSKDAIIKSVLAKHNVTPDAYKITIQYYNQDSERWEKFFSQAITYLEKKRENSAK